MSVSDSEIAAAMGASVEGRQVLEDWILFRVNYDAVKKLPHADEILKRFPPAKLRSHGFTIRRGET